MGNPTDGRRVLPDGRPIANSYWAVDGVLLGGEYPGAATRVEARTRLVCFLAAGVRRFVDLTEAGEYGLEPYASLLREVAAERGLTVRYARHPIPDMSVPSSPEVMAAVLDEIGDGAGDGGLTYVHCWGGTGRTGTAVGCLYRRLGASAESALAEVGRRWSTMAKAPDRPWGSPENELQRRYVREWPVGG
jgi:hypothetical protein